jgi:hypothetical protein
MISLRCHRDVCRFAIVACALIAVTSAQAHLMVEQHGTVNFANGGAFLVLSVPVSAFDGVDDDGDGGVSAEELRLHTTEVLQQLHDGVQLLDDSGEPLPLQGLLLSLVPPDHNGSEPATQLIALGRFPVDAAMVSPGLYINLHGEAPAERRITITATRDGHSQQMLFTPDQEFHTMFPIENFAD